MPGLPGASRAVSARPVRSLAGASAGGSGRGRRVGTDQVTVEVARVAGNLRVCVACAKSLTKPQVRAPGSRGGGGGGLGLRIVELLTTEWGVEDHGLDTVVWAKVPFQTR